MFVIKLTDLENRPFDAEECVKWQKKFARRKSKALGLVEQAKSIKTERDAIDALANYEANFRKKSYAVINEWHEAFPCWRFESVRKICEKDFLHEQCLTVGDYLKVSKVSKPQAVKKKRPFKRRAQTVNFTDKKTFSEIIPYIWRKSK